ncbi:hypothetical protein ASF12_33050 [Paenibacillus sp. Leaf72]|nr:hypothetical protein ASF12_33050 [Paenibacillus sp. Leaf72]
MNAYLDAAQLDMGRTDAAKGKSLLALVNERYGMDSGANGLNATRYTDYVEYVAPAIEWYNPMTNVLEYQQSSDEEKKFTILKNMISGQLEMNHSTENAEQITDQWLQLIRTGLAAEQTR